MTLSDFTNQLRGILFDLARTNEIDAAQVAQECLSLVQDRIITTGTSSTGRKFAPYSTNGMLKYRLYGKARNASAEERLRSGPTLISYAGFRRLNGLQVAHRDFFFTGAMWRGTGVAIRPTGNTVVARIEGRNPDAAKKLRENSERVRVNILLPSALEIEVLRQAWKKRRLNRIASKLR